MVLFGTRIKFRPFSKQLVGTTDRWHTNGTKRTNSTKFANCQKKKNLTNDRKNLGHSDHFWQKITTNFGKFNRKYLIENASLTCYCSFIGSTHW